MDYYGAENKIRSKKTYTKLNNTCKFYIISSLIFTLIILTIINTYYVFSTVKEVGTLRVYSITTDENIDLIKKEIERGIKPRLMLIDRVITYQLPSAIIRAFEISHQDLRMSLASITLDLKRVIELYKALLGFTDDWILANDAQQLQCSWSPKRNLNESYTHGLYDNSTYQSVKQLKDAFDNENANDYSIKSELNNVLQLFNTLINEFRFGRNSTFKIQTDSYQYSDFESELSNIIDNLLTNISSLIKDQEFNERLYNLKYDRYLYNKHNQLVNVLQEIEKQNEYLVNQTLRLKKSINPDYILDHKRIIKENNPDFIFEPSSSYISYYPGESTVSLRDFYNVSIRKAPYKINLGSHKIKKRYVKPGVYRLPTFSYNTHQKPKPDSINQDLPLQIDNWNFGSINDQCKKYKIPGYDIYYCKSSINECL